MQPSELKPEYFARYPAAARQAVIGHLDALRRLPLSFVPSLLREVIEYDFKFPIERLTIDRELGYLSSLSHAQIEECFRAFAKIRLSAALQQSDWIDAPAQFLERQSAYLWSTHQMDAFRAAAMEYGERLQAAIPPEAPAVNRLGIAVIGQGAISYEGLLFKNLRKHGTYFSHIDPEGGLEKLQAHAEQRAKQYPMAYGHWYVAGGAASAQLPGLTQVSYERLAPARSVLLKRMQEETLLPGGGPEELRSYMARLSPADLGMDPAGDALLDRFQLKLLTEGSGTQIYSTTFAQWTTREVLRRAQALTLMVRFAPRQRQRPMHELLTNTRGGLELDAAGSLVDADMAAYYHWLNQQRLTGAERSSFVVWYEGHQQALVVAPFLPRGAQSTSVLNLEQLVTLATT